MSIISSFDSFAYKYATQPTEVKTQFISSNVSYHKFKVKKCFYILHDPWRGNGLNIYKFGYTHNINQRLRSYRTSMPSVQIKLLLYSENAKTIEKIFKHRAGKFLVYSNHEYVANNICLSKIKEICLGVIKTLNADFEFETEDNLQKYNLSHLRKQDNNIDCKICLDKFHSQFKLQHHYDVCHALNSQHSCDLCGNYYINKLSLRLHVKNKH